MWCKENTDGDIACELDLEDEVTFSIEELSRAKYDDPNYMGHEFDETYVYQFPDTAQEVEEDFAPFAGVIEMACNDYDKFNFAVKMVQAGQSQQNIGKFSPELRNKNLMGVSPLSEDYDSFNIEAFYSFCRKHPVGGEDQAWAYPFVTLKNVN